ncbi:PadR family transcriptional regulator [Vulcanimicrobium alpinum]|nr:PadR family transcriptional regulator [Vulcanimicrobium alpinum]
MMNLMMRRAFSRHGHGRGGRPWGPPGGGPWGGGWGPGWGGRQRRGDVKYLVLEMLAEGPKHGYEIIRWIEERRGVRPSAGSVYPTLQLLEDGSYVTSEQIEGKRVYTITESGRELLTNRASEGADPDDGDGEPDPRHRLKEAAFKLGAAVMSARGADDATLDRIRAVVDRARKEIYAILAADEG